MGLVSCKVCGTQVAASALTCPNCGVSHPGAGIGKLAIIRTSAITGEMYAVQVFVDGELMGEVNDGTTLTLELPAGRHTAKVVGGGMSRQATIGIADGKTTRYQMYFSNWGFLGGGLNFKPA